MNKIYEINPNFAHVKDFLFNIDEHFLNSNKTIHKARNEIKILTFHEQQMAVKSFKILSIFKRFIYTFLRPSKAKRSFLYSQKLQDFTPKPIAYIEFLKFNMIEKSYYLSEKFEHDFSIREPLFDDDFKNREEILKQFSNFVFSLHENGIYHLDLSPGNVLIKQENDRYIFKIVDVNRMKFFTPNFEQRMKNFNKLWAREGDLKILAKEHALLLNEDENRCFELMRDYTKMTKNISKIKRFLKGKK